MNPCLWLHVEGNTNKGGGGRGAGQPNKNLEEEAIRCVKYWKKYDVMHYPIYALCMTNNPPSTKTLKKLNDMEVIFIWNHIKHLDWFPAGWWYTPVAGAWMEDNTNHNPLIHLDLDMILLRPFELTNDWENYDAMIPAYTEIEPDDRQISPDFKKTFITCFIISKRNFYRDWFAEMNWLAWKWKKKYPALHYEPKKAKYKVSKEVWWDYCNLEEHAVDSLFYKNELWIKKLEKTMIGESQGYGSANDATDNEIMKNIYFLHHHYDPKNPNSFEKNIKEYVTRKARCKK